MLKHGEEALHGKMYKLIKYIWAENKMQYIKMVYWDIIPIHKKRNKEICKN